MAPTKVVQPDPGQPLSPEHAEFDRESPIGLPRGLWTGLKLYLALAGIGYAVWSAYHWLKGGL